MILALRSRRQKQNPHKMGGKIVMLLVKEHSIFIKYRSRAKIMTT